MSTLDKTSGTYTKTLGAKALASLKPTKSTPNHMTGKSPRLKK